MFQIIKQVSFGVLLLTAFLVQGKIVSAAPACDGTIYALNGTNIYYKFDPTITSTPTLIGTVGATIGTIARGPATGNIYSIATNVTSAPLYSIPIIGAPATLVGTFPNTAFIYASGFQNNGTGYALDSSESFSFTDANPSVITKLPAPTTTSGQAISAFSSGDLAFDITNQGYTILTNNATKISYLYMVNFTAGATSLTQVAQISLGGKAYVAGDLYDFAFGTGNIAYTSSANKNALYSLDTTTGVLTLKGAQGISFNDFASCPFFANPTITKTGPSKSAAGDLMQYQVTATNAASASASLANVNLTDPVPAGIAIKSVLCSVTGGAVCGIPTVTGQTVTATATTIPAGGSATLVILANDATLALGTATNTATFTATNATINTAATSATIVGNTVTKTVANITQGTVAGTADNAVPKDILEYVISYTNTTNGPLANFALNDLIPANLSYIPGSSACTTTPVGLTCTPTGPTAGNLSWPITGGTVPNGATITVKFRATVN